MKWGESFLKCEVMLVSFVWQLFLSESVRGLGCFFGDAIKPSTG